MVKAIVKYTDTISDRYENANCMFSNFLDSVSLNSEQKRKQKKFTAPAKADLKLTDLTYKCPMLEIEVS